MMTVDELKGKIYELSGIRPASKSQAFLSARLRELRRHVPMHVSTSTAAKLALGELAENTDTTVSDIARKAIAEWAQRNGHDFVARLFDEGGVQ